MAIVEDVKPGDGVAIGCAECGQGVVGNGVAAGIAVGIGCVGWLSEKIIVSVGLVIKIEGEALGSSFQHVKIRNLSTRQ